jgi:hypothetical protein
MAMSFAWKPQPRHRANEQFNRKDLSPGTNCEILYKHAEN